MLGFVSARAVAALALTVAALALSARPAAAHPHHVSRGEAVLNPRTGHLEVSLSFEAKDLARALARSDGRRVDWSQEELTARIAAYLAPRFTVSTPDGAAKMVVAGWAPDGQRVWVHFEMRSVARLDGAVITHAALMELEPGQLNTLQIRSGAFKASLMFDRAHRQRRVDTRGTP